MMNEAEIYKTKDISKLRLKVRLTGGERIPVSKDEYVTLQQIFEAASRPSSASLANEFILVRADPSGGYNAEDKFYHYRISIGNYKRDLTDNKKYRLCYIYTRRAKDFYLIDGKKKKSSKGIKWTVPMLGCLLGNPSGASIEKTFIPITSKEMSVKLLSGGIESGKSLYRNKKGLSRFRLTQNTRWKTGVAIFKYTATGNPGWYRCSNIFGLELSIGNRAVDSIDRVNTGFLVE